MTNVDERGHVSGAAQIASRISGAFNAGFEILGDLSGSATSTGSFAKVFANHYVGDASQMTNAFISPGTVSGSAQLATAISGAFNAGFEFSNEISGSATSTGSFGRVEAGGTVSADAFVSTTGGATIDFNDDVSLAGSLTTTGKIELGREPVQGFNYLARLANAAVSLGKQTPP